MEEKQTSHSPNVEVPQPFGLWDFKRKGICNETFNVTRKDDEEVRKIEDLFNSILNNFDSNSCKQPCTKYAFETKFLYNTHWSWNENLIGIIFSKKVELTKV